MPQKDLHHRLTGDSSSLVQANSRASRSMTAAEREAHKLEQQQRRTHQAMTEAGRGMLVAGAAIAAGIGLAVRAAVQWESAWAGVTKTVEGTEEQLSRLEDELRAMARELPQSHTEIAAVAEAAGQLGIATEDVASFTRVMVDLGVATNLTSEEAAFAIARMTNIMGTATGDVDRLGAAIVDLGNNSATTEAEILEMALRISGAGATIGLSETDVLAFAASLSSVGVAAQAGGSAISRAMIAIEESVRAGDESLETIAQTAGMSAAEFTSAYERDAANAIATFVAGLGRMQTRGEDVFATLDRLGFTEIRLRDALLRLSASGDLLTSSLERGAQAWDENEALMAEAERRYGTTEAQMQIARNQLNDFSIDIGQTFLPVLGSMASGLGSVAEVLAALPGPMKAAIALLAASAAAVGLLGGAALIAIPKIAAFNTALNTMAAGAGRAAVAARGLRAATGFMFGPWGAAIAVAVGLVTAAVGAYSVNQAEANAQAAEFADTLDEVTGKVTEVTRAKIAHRLEEQGALEMAQELGIGISELVDEMMAGKDAAEILGEIIDDLGGGSMKRTNGSLFDLNNLTEDNTEAWTDLREAVGATGGELEDGIGRWQRLNEAEEENLTATTDLAPQQRDLADAFGVSASAAEDVAGAVDDLDQELKQLFDRVFGLSNLQDDLANAFDKVAEAVKKQHEEAVEGAAALDGMTRAARDNRDLTQDLLRTYAELALETIESTGSMEEAEKVASRFEEQLDELEKQTGLNVRELDGYNEVVGEIDRLIKVTFRNDGVAQAIEQAQRIREHLERIDRTVRISFETRGFASVDGVAIPRHTGGAIPGHGGQDSRLVAASPGEFMVNTLGAAHNRAALEAANAGARLAVVGTGGGSATSAAPATSGPINVYLTSYSDRYSTKQVLEDLKLRGAS